MPASGVGAASGPKYWLRAVASCPRSEMEVDGCPFMGHMVEPCWKSSFTCGLLVETWDGKIPENVVSMVMCQSRVLFCGVAMSQMEGELSSSTCQCSFADKVGNFDDSRSLRGRIKWVRIPRLYIVLCCGKTCLSCVEGLFFILFMWWWSGQCTPADQKVLDSISHPGVMFFELT